MNTTDNENNAVLADFLGSTVGVTQEEKQMVERASDLYNAMSPEFRVKHEKDINLILRLIRKIANL